MYIHLSQKWGSDGHFDVLHGSKFWLVQRLWHKEQIFAFPFFCDFVQKHSFVFLGFFILCHNFCTFLGFRLIKHLKMTVWTSVLWKINIHEAKKLPEMVVKLSFMSQFYIETEYIFQITLLNYYFQYMALTKCKL